MSEIKGKGANNRPAPAGWSGGNRRSGIDRRKGERRQVNMPVKEDRRRGKDRRSPTDRRQCPLA